MGYIALISASKACIEELAKFSDTETAQSQQSTFTAVTTAAA